MLKLAKLGIAIAVLATLIVPAAYAGVPDVTQSYFVPQSGAVATPAEGTTAVRNARRCPNNDLVASTSSARLKVVVRASDGTPIVGIGASDICVLFNGGTPAQGFSGVGDDSIIANSTRNGVRGCPDVRCVQADAATDVNGVTYISWAGPTVGSPGVATRSSDRKWGGYAGDIPVMVLGFKLTGWLTSAAAEARTPALGNYTAHTRNVDMAGGRTTLGSDIGEIVNNVDKNALNGAAPPYPPNSYKYFADFDTNGLVNNTDNNFLLAHAFDTCNLTTHGTVSNP